MLWTAPNRAELGSVRVMRFGSCGSNRRASSESRNPKASQWCRSYTVPHHPIFLLAPYIPARPQNYSSFDNLLWWLQRWGGGWGEVEEVKLRQIERHRIYVFHIIVSIKCHFCSAFVVSLCCSNAVWFDHPWMQACKAARALSVFGLSMVSGKIFYHETPCLQRRLDQQTRKRGKSVTINVRDWRVPWGNQN